MQITPCNSRVNSSGPDSNLKSPFSSLKLAYHFGLFLLLSIPQLVFAQPYDATLSATPGAEGGSNVIFTVTLDAINSSGFPITFELNPNGGTASAGDFTDFTAETISIPNGSDTGTFNVVLNDDALFENTETLGGIISNPSDGTVTIVGASTVTNITDNDNGAGTVTANLSVTDGTEGSTDVIFTATLSKTNNTGSPITLSINPNGLGTAVSGTDYPDFTGGIITIADGSATGTYQVTPALDGEFENVEDFGAIISAPSDPAVVVGTATATGNINDGDTANLVLSVTTQGNEAGPVSIVYTATLSSINSKSVPITVQINPDGGTATASSDYSNFSGRIITILPGSNSGTVNVSVADDNFFESTETVTGTLSAVSDPGVTITGPSATANITDNDNTAASVNSLLTLSGLGSEAGATTMTLTVSLSKKNFTGSPIVFDLSQTAGTATDGADYTDLTGATISVANGSDIGTFSFSVVDDALFENDETFTISLSNPSNPAINLFSPNASGVIVDNDNVTATTNAVLSVNNGTEGGSDLIFNVTLSQTNNTGVPITFEIYRNGGSATVTTDYSDYAGLISVPNGSNVGTLNVTIVDDAFFENSETVAAGIYNPSDPAIQITVPKVTGNIIDNDNVTIGADLTAEVNGNEAGRVSIVYRVTLTNANNTGSDIFFDIDPIGGTATPGIDYVDFTGRTIRVGSGSSIGEISVEVTDDSLIENDQTAEAVITNSSDPAVTIGTANATASIIDNDNSIGSITADLVRLVDGHESGLINIIYQVELSEVNYTDSAITFNIDPIGGTGTAGVDYVDFTGAQIVVPSGSRFGQFTVAVLNDPDLTSDTVVAQISSPSDTSINLGTDTATATINDDDAPTGTYNASIRDAVIQGNETGVVNVSFVVELSEPNTTGSAITFDINPLVGGTATLTSDYTNFTGQTVSIPNGASQATFNVTVVNDTLYESTESLFAEISNPSSGAVTIIDSDAVGYIYDNDQIHSAVITGTVNGAEAGLVAMEYTITIPVINNTQNPIQFNIASAGGRASSGVDYDSLVSSTISIPVGANSVSFTVDVLDDLLFENTENAIISMLNPSDPGIYLNFGNTRGSASIIDNDNIGVNAVLDVLQDGSEAGPTSMIYRVTLSEPNNTGGTIFFDIDPIGGSALPGDAVENNDYIDFTGSRIGVPSGSSTGTFSVSISNDTRFENIETIETEISNPSDPAAVSIITAVATGNINDNDNAPADVTASISTFGIGNEDGPTSVTFLVTLSNINFTDQDVTFDINPTGGTATVGSDYVDFSAIQVAIPYGQDRALYTITVLDDALFENTETIEATLSNPSDPAIDITTATATGLLLDNDNVTNTINANLSVTTQGEENLTNIVYTVTLDEVNDTPFPIDFTLYVDGGTAVAGTDYTNFNGVTISVPVGSNQGTYTVNVTNDLLFENLETAIAELANPSDAAIVIGTAIATANITDDDVTVANIAVTTNGDEDGPVDLVYTISISNTNGTGSDIEIDVDPDGGTATIGSDYTTFAGSTVIIPDGSSSVTLTVPVLDDSLFENTETVGAEISNLSHPSLSLATATATGDILDDENGVGAVNAVLSTITNGTESGTQIRYRVTLATINNTGSPITFDIDPTAGTAIANTDYTTFAGATITVANGASTGDLLVTVTDDTLFENTETATATITNASDPAINISTGSATANIIDNDNTASSISAVLTTTQNGNETGPVDISLLLTIGKINNTGAPIVFTITPSGEAVSGSDYTGLTTISIPDGSDTGTLILTVVDDLLFENEEDATFTVTAATDPAITTGSNTTPTITDNDNTATSITANLSKTTDGLEGTTNIVFTVTLDKVNNTHAPILIDIDPTGGTAIAGTDYTNFAGAQISIPDGSSSGTYTVIVTNDALFENTETVQATITNPYDPAVTLGTTLATADIVDSSPQATITATTSGNETGPVSIVYSVNLGKTNDTGATITFDVDRNTTEDGSADVGTDYTNFDGTTVDIINGASSATVTVPVDDDALFENNETVIATLSNVTDPRVTIATANATGTIIDNDNPTNGIPINLSVTQDGNETGPVSIIYTVTLGTVNNTHAALVYNLRSTGGNASVGTDYTALNTTTSTITIPDGSNVGTLTVPVTNDALFENNETVQATLTRQAVFDPAVAIGTGVATANIVDNDNGATTVNASLSTVTNGTEAGTAIRYRVTLAVANNTHAPITFAINPTSGTATAVSDYTFGTTTITVADGASTGDKTVATVNDILFENTETVVSTISTPSDPAINIVTASSSANITDNDSPSASIATTTQGNETGPVSIVYTVSISRQNATGVPITFNVNPTGGNADATDDYTNFAATVASIADGASSTTVTVPVVDDSLFENTETVQATISSPSNGSVTIGTAAATANITDNDNPVNGINIDLAVTQDGNETGPVNIIYTATLATVNNTHQPLIYNLFRSGGNASMGTDYTNLDATTTTISIPHGSNTGTRIITVVNDSLFENDETVTATMSRQGTFDPAVRINTASDTADIIDNDNGAGTVDAVLDVQTQGIEGSVNVVFRVTLENTNNTHLPINFNIDPNGGTAITGTDYTTFAGGTITVADGSNTGTLTVTLTNDALFENLETIIALITSSIGIDPAINILTSGATANITDNDTTTANIAVTTDGDETGPVSAVYTISLTNVNGTGVPITIDVNPNGGTATVAGLDYTDFTGSTVSIADGASSTTLTVPVADDLLLENDETIIARITNPSNGALTIGTANATADLIDNDNTPGSVNADLSVTTNGVEGGANIVYRVDIGATNNTHAPISFTINPTGGDATAGSDYTTFASGTISVPDGANFGTLTVNVTDDALFENLEEVEATITSPSDPVIDINTASATASITDNDNGITAVDADLSVTTQGVEGSINIVYTVTLANANNTGVPITFAFNPTGGTAITGTDYTDFTGGVISIPNGSATGTFTVVITNDNLFENLETVIGTISAASDPAINIVTATATADITNDDTTTASIVATTDGDEDGPISIVYTVSISNTNGTGQPITIDVDPNGGNATVTSDFADFAGTTVTIPDGSSSDTVTVVVVDDAILEHLETVEATISNLSDGDLSIATASATADIVDNDDAVGAVNADLTVTTQGVEGGTNIVYTVTLANVNGTHSPITFDINPSGGTAIDGTDYTTFINGLVSIADGASTGTYTVFVTNDTLFENLETLESTISNVSDTSVNINTASATANITDNDNAVGSIDADLSVTTQGVEGSINVVYTVTLGTVNNTGGPITFAFNPSGGTAIAGTDYTDFTGGVITILDGESTGTYTVVITDDSLFEDLETIIGTISAASDPAINIATASATADISNDDTTTASISATINGNETGPISIVYTVTLTNENGTGTAITFEVNPNGGTAIAGIDYTDFTAGSVSIADGDTTGTLTVPVVDDNILENLETAIAEISNPSNGAITIATASDTADILDNDNVAGTVDADLSVTTQGVEGGFNIVYTITLANPNGTGAPLTFSINPTGGTATITDDFTDFTGGTISVADGASTGTFTVFVANDTLFENLETVEATVSSPSDPAINLNTPTATANITDNDNVVGSIDADLSVTTQGVEGSVNVVYTVTLGTVNNTGGPITFAFNPTGGTAITGTDYTDFTNGVITILDGESTGTYTVVITDDSLFENLETIIGTITAASDAAINIVTASATADITNDDTTTASIVATTNGDEDGPVSIVYTVSISNPNGTGQPITIDVDPSGGNATAGTDYTDFAGASVSIADGESSDTITLVVDDDAILEHLETVEATISNLSDGDLSIATASATADILDNDDAAGSVDADLSVTTQGVEGGTNILYTVTLANVNGTHTPITFDINPTGGTATDGSDYTTFSNGLITIADGASTGTYTVFVTDDSLFENLETLESTISNASDASININTASATADITDNDNGAGTINASLAITTNGSENNLGSVTDIVVTLTLATINNTGADITFDLDLNNGTATAWQDFNVSGAGFATVVVPNGSNTATIIIPVIEDSNNEGTEDLDVVIFNPSDTAINIVTGTVTPFIVDDEANNCGSGTLDLFEQCDDSNTDNADGCDSFCQIETGYTCEGEPSVCHETCGNGVITGRETCDDGNEVDGDGCSDICRIETGFSCFGDTSLCASGCGNGTVAGLEECDDADNVDGDGCSATCTLEPVWSCSGAAPSICTNTCGDSTLDAGEACDDGNVTEGDGCTASCVIETAYSCTGTPSTCSSTCGDAEIASDEQCDDGNTTTGDGCDASCSIESTFTCVGVPSICLATCGNNIITDGEVCDDGNLVNGDGCSNTCEIEIGSSCVGEPSACTATCGDNTVDVGEACDDGDNTNFDGCSEVCQIEIGYECNGNPSGCLATCGNGTMEGGESCDDKNFVNGDGCSAACRVEVGFSCLGEPSTCDTSCGDGIITGTETCDDSNGIGGDGCSATCQIEDTFACTGEPSSCLATCSNGTIDAGEACDDGNATNGDGCSAICEVETGESCLNTSGEPSLCYTACGNGTIDAFEQCDDSNNTSDDGCSASCLIEIGYVCTGTPSACVATCGNGHIASQEACDDANQVSGDGCSNVCLNEVNATLSFDQNGTEAGPDAVEFLVTLDTANATGANLNFLIKENGGVASTGVDYTGFNNQIVTVASGATTGTLSVPVIDDLLFENSESVDVLLKDTSHPAVLIGTDTATGDIIDNDNVITATLAGITNGNETGPVNAVFQVTLSAINNTGSPITFVLNPNGGTATLGDDYADFTGTIVTIPIGSDTATFTVIINNDAFLEATTETLIAALSTSSDSSVTIGTSTASITISDDEALLDDDFDTIPNYVECPTGIPCVNTDGDPNPNYLDTDSDNDGILDDHETVTDTDGDNIPNYIDEDSDNDGIKDENEKETDFDGDLIPNYLDLDSDGDSIPDAEEGDSDQDGDGQPNYLDLDSDNDGVTDTLEKGNTNDGDGIPDYLDIDADNDGITDIIEAGGVDTDQDGTVDGFVDADQDGLSDNIAITSLAIPDTDGDGLPDMLDIDADGDGINDNIEGQVSIGYIDPSGLDANSNGLDDAYDALVGGFYIIPVDTDSDGDPDYQDLDSDGDGLSDYIEAYDSDYDFIADVLPLGVDSDNDGLDDGFDTFDRSLSTNWVANLRGSNIILNDLNFDGTPDFREFCSGSDCGGCEEISPTKKVKKKAKNANNAASILHNRTISFSQRAEACGSPDLSKSRVKSKELLAQFRDLVNASFKDTKLDCAQNDCLNQSSKSVTNKLNRIATRLFKIAKKSKLEYIDYCKPVHDPNDTRKRSEDYLDDLNAAIKALPKSHLVCD